MQTKYLGPGCLALLLLWFASAVQTQTPQKTPATQTPSTRPAPVVRRDNYNDLRAKYAERLESEKQERERRKHQGNVLYEDQYELEFERWDRYWRDHLDAGSRERGKMTDMSRHQRHYFMAAQSAAKGSSAQSTSLVCPSAGLGNWTSLGPSTYAAPIMGKVMSVYVDPSNPNTAYAGAAEGGLFKTVNNGASWTNLTDASHFPALGVSSIAVHPTIPTTIYLGTSNGGPGSAQVGGGPYGFGILKSINGGTTWQEIFTLATYNNQANYNIGQGASVSKIMLHPQDPNTIYALAAHYVFRSTDGGVTWQQMLEITPPNPNPDNCGYRLVDIDIINGTSGVSNSSVMVSTVRTAWLGLANSPCGTAKSFISLQGGAAGTFTDITSVVMGSEFADRIAAAVQPGNSADFFIAYANLSVNYVRIKRYNIAGNISSQQTVVISNGVFQLGAGFWNLELQFSQLNANTLYIAGTTAYRVDVANSISGIQVSDYWATNATYCTPAAKTHADIRSMTVSTSGANDVVILGSDGGIHKAVLDPATGYTPATANWHDMTGPGLAINEFFDINGMEANPNLLVGGTQDNGTFEYNNGIWKQRFNYDGYQGTINQATGGYYGMTNAGPIKGPTGTPGTYSFVSGPDIYQGPVVSDPNNPAVIYQGRASLYKSTNFGALWTTLPSPPGTIEIRAIHVAPSNSNVIYISRSEPTWNPSNLTNRLFRSSDGGNTWTDIGGNAFPLAYASVSDIAVDPDDANRVWISLNGYWATSNTSTAGAFRVYYSGDGGNTWTDFTYNLPAFPVATLIYQRGSDDTLYVGTDVGVFRFNKALQLWECFNNQLPVVPVTKLEINNCKNKIRAATYGRGIYESDLPALPSEVVNTSVTWSGLRYLSNDLTIAPGATLTLTGTLYLSKDKRIIVQRGATLNVNGGTITNACGDMWYGIEVWGKSSAPQNLVNAQGRVLMQGNAKIQNAIAAITTGKDVNTTPDLNYTGGIVQITSSAFYNNQSSVRFLPYSWMSGPNELNNLSYCKDCTFETNRRLNDATLLPLAHVSLNSIKNVVLLGCKFNNTALTTVYGVNNRGDGVVSTNAEYVVDDGTLPLAPSVFNGLTYGVRADFVSSSTKKVTVQNSDFNNVQRGVLVNYSTGSIVNGNNFNAQPNSLTTSLANATWGVRMNHVTGFSVSNNFVTGASAAYQNNYGVIIDNCGSATSNLVKGNTLKNLYTGIYARGLNGNGGNGVKFRCNVFQPSMAYQLSIEIGSTLATQGGACVLGQTADNTFFAQASPVGSQINAPQVFAFYFASGTLPTNNSGLMVVINCLSVVGECPP